MKRPVEFYSEGFKLCGDVYTPDDLSQGEQRAAVLLCHGYTGVKDLYLPDNAASLNQAGYVAMTFDYKGWGESQGTRNRLAPYSRVMDVQAAMTFLGCQPEVDEDRIGLYGTSYGGATVSWVGAVDQRAKCIVSVVGVGHGARWMSRVRRVDEWFDLLERSPKTGSSAPPPENWNTWTGATSCSQTGSLRNLQQRPGGTTPQPLARSPSNTLTTRSASTPNGS